MQQYLSRRFCGVLLLLCASALTLSAQLRPRITGPVNNSSTMRLAHTTHPLATVANEIGRADASLPMERILLHLTSSADQETAIEQLVAAQHDPNSPSYHQWLTPEQFGQQFGVAQADLGAINNWLQTQGFTVNEVAAGRRGIEFSGTAQQVERAFHTEMHRYRVNGTEHVANSTDISIPSALADVVGGVVSLHNFRVHPLHTVVRSYPLTNLTGGSHALSPYDFAAIYDVAALWNLNFDGTGQTVAVAGRTNINPTDITTFRSTFGLPGNNTQIIVNGTNPGIISADEETEADLDVEWSGGIAKGATIQLVVSASTNSSDGVDLSDQYIVNNNLAPVMSLSFGSCEAQNGSSNSFYNSLWQQAAAQGISVFVAAGDSGSAACDLDYSTNNSGADNTAPASQGFAVNGLASTQYNVAVGGNEFNDSASPSTYWNSSNNTKEASAKGYIPEVVWNESSYIVGAGNNTLYAGGGGVSSLWATPTWQTGTGVPTSDPGASGQHHRYMPDVSLSAAGHDGYLIYQEGQLELVGGTSASTPSFAGLMAIIDQYTGGGRNGNPNTHFYPLATQFPALFHDVTTGINAVPCVGGAPNCSSTIAGTNGVMDGYSAAAGYDLATGLGSVDAYALALQWSGGQVTPSITSLSPNPMTGSTANQTLTINGTGFVSGDTVKVSYTGFSGTLTITSLTATQILATINTGTTAQTWTVQVANSGGTLSNSASLTVNAPPVITSLSPNPMTGSTANQTLTINGTGFVSGDTVKVSYTGFSGTLTITSLTATQILATINTGTAAQTWTVQVANASGTISNSASLTVNAPPVITSLSPNPMTGSTSNQTLTINGSGFVTGDTVKVSYTGFSGSLTITSLTATQILATINTGTTAQAWTVQVANASGTLSNSASLTVNAPPTITSLSPNPMTGSTSNQTLTINGSGFVTGNTVKVSYTGFSGSLTITSLTATQILATINTGTTAQVWTVQVANASGMLSNSASLTVNAPPAITSLTPNPMTGSTANQTLTINGIGFVTGDTVKVSYPGYSGTLTITSLTATQILATINTGTTAQTWTVQVANASGTLSNSASLTVNAPPAITSLSPNPMTGSTSNQTLTINGSGFVTGDTVKVSYTGFSGTLTITSLTATQILATINTGTTARTWTVQVANASGTLSNSASLTVNAPPAITSLTPNPMTGSTSNQTLTINGSGFVSGDTVKVSYTGFSGTLTITSLTANQILATINTGTTAQTWTVQVADASGTFSNSASLTVNAPAAPPTITSLTPNPMTGADTFQTVTINGTGFVAGDTVRVTNPQGYSITLQPSSLSATQVQAAFVSAELARTLLVQVMTASGIGSNAVSLQIVPPTTPAIAR